MDEFSDGLPKSVLLPENINAVDISSISVFKIMLEHLKYAKQPLDNESFFTIVMRTLTHQRN